MGNASLRTIWNAPDHTPGKHALLSKYLGAWFPIVGSSGKPALYIDGFAGPGRYSMGEPGSPIVVLKLALEHTQPIRNDVTFAFIESDLERAANLEQEIETLRKSCTFPPNFTTRVVKEDCERVLLDFLGLVDAGHPGPEFVFAFLDPHGFDVSFDLVAKILAKPKREVLVNVMVDYMKRFATSDHHDAAIDRMFLQPGTAARLAELPVEKRREEARRRYFEGLTTKASFVRSFEIRRSDNRPIYDLVFASNNEKGHEVFKRAMWSLDPTGDFSYCPRVAPTEGCLLAPSHARYVAERVRDAFRGKTADGPEVRRFVMNNSDFIDRHATAALDLLETTGIDGYQIAVDEGRADGTKRRGKTFGPGIKVRFPS